MTKKFNQYFGKAGHLSMMSEFLMRGWNVAIPEVDIGDDIFVVQDDSGTLRRVQVKTSNSTSRQGSISGKFSVSAKNLKNLSKIPVHYVFLLRHEDSWMKPIIIRQDELLEYVQTDNIGSQAAPNIIFYLSYSNGKVECSGQDFTKHISDFTDFPQVIH